MKTVVKVDCHQHFWQLSRNDYDWLTPDLPILYKDQLPNDLLVELTDHEVNQTVLIQAAANEKETTFLLEIANQTSYVCGVVGWVDLESSKAIETLHSFNANHYFKGIRPMLQDIDDIDWILKEEFTGVFQFLAKNNLTFDALINDIHLPNIHKLALKYPTLKIVIDHCAKPDLAHLPSANWKQNISNVASCNNVVIKLSGLLTEAPEGAVSVNVLQAYFDHILAAFGSSRILWGSDWPVVNLNGNYGLWVSLTDSLLQKCSIEDKRKIWGSNAQVFYQLHCN